MASTQLGDFLRTRRALAQPAEFGLPSTGARRVAGLRRDEVALLAGMSVDYYVRLEQGRERSPSVQLLDALGRALRLDDDARLHLFRLAGLSPAPRPSGGREDADPDLRQLMDGWPDNPALVLGRTYDVLARNRIGTALFEAFTYSDNLLLNMFLDPVARWFYADWYHAAGNAVAGYRLSAGAVPDDPAGKRVLAELDASVEFGQLWARHDARGKSAEVKTFRHREVGELTLRMQTFDVRSAPGQQLVVYHAEPGSPSAHGLRLLGALAATEDHDAAGSGQNA